MMIQHHATVDNIKAISLGGKNFRASIYVSNVTQHHLRCHPQTVHCQIHNNSVKVKVIPQQAKVAQGVPGRLRPQIFLMFGTTRVVGRQPYTPATFTLGEIPGSHFQRLSRPQGTWFRRGGATEKKSPVTPPGINLGTVQLVAQCLNHYTTSGLTTVLYTH
jgi:hypothetical protein